MSLKNYRLFDVRNKQYETMNNVFESLKTIFDIGDEDIDLIVNPWLEIKATELNNKITDIQYKIYAATGVEIKLTTEQLIELIEVDDSGMEGYIVSTSKEG